MEKERRLEIYKAVKQQLINDLETHGDYYYFGICRALYKYTNSFEIYKEEVMAADYPEIYALKPVHITSENWSREYWFETSKERIDAMSEIISKMEEEINGVTN